MKKSLLTSVLALSCSAGALADSGPSAAPATLDGNWVAHVTSTMGTCPSDTPEMRFAVNGNQITRTGPRIPKNATGTIQSDGSFSFSFPSTVYRGYTISYDGQIIATSISGQMTAKNGASVCLYSFSGSKK